MLTPSKNSTPGVTNVPKTTFTQAACRPRESWPEPGPARLSAGSERRPPTPAIRGLGRKSKPKSRRYHLPAIVREEKTDALCSMTKDSTPKRFEPPEAKIEKVEEESVRTSYASFRAGIP